jgi:DNA-binding PadR family transcriptional regulator
MINRDVGVSLMEQEDVRGRGYLLKQRAFLKLYLLTLIEQKREYGMQYMDHMHQEFSAYGYKPTHSEIYKSLHELAQEGILYRNKKIKGDPKTDFQEVVYYQFTEDGHHKAKLYKKQLKVELDRCVGLLQKAIKDNY